MAIPVCAAALMAGNRAFADHLAVLDPETGTARAPSVRPHPPDSR
jgi:hypothetical protein